MTPGGAARDREAWNLMQAAHRMIQSGELPEAAAALERAAAIHQEAGRDYDRARCLQLAATLRRFSGDTKRAKELAESAAAAAPEDLPLGVSIAAEQAEEAFGEARYPDAERLWDEAIAKAREAGAKPEGLSALLRRRAAAQMSQDHTRAAAESFDEAARLVEFTIGPEAAGFVQAEHAGLLLQHGRTAQALQVLDGIDAGESAYLRGEVLVLRARGARSAGRKEDAERYAREAREAALEAVAPVTYFAASAELAEALEGRADRVGAYGTMAAASATLGDLLGADVARSWVEPALMAYQMKWGEAAFAEARAAYEARRRQEKKR